MSTIVSSIWLSFVVSTTPILHTQIVSNFDDLATCQLAIDTIAKQEKDEPADKQINKRLICQQLSYRYDPDGDGPSKPVVPSNNKPMFHSANPEDVPCKADESKMCRNTSYKE